AGLLQPGGPRKQCVHAQNAQAAIPGFLPHGGLPGSAQRLWWHPSLSTPLAQACIDPAEPRRDVQLRGIRRRAEQQAGAPVTGISIGCRRFTMLTFTFEMLK